MSKLKHYEERALACFLSGNMQPGDLANIQAHHDDWCPKLNGGDCKCCPDMLISHSRLGLCEIDRYGKLKKARAKWKRKGGASDWMPHAVNN
jgi:hypothetical protein